MRRTLTLPVSILLAVLLSGCAMFGDGPSGEQAGDAEVVGMTQYDMEIVFSGEVEKIEGPSGAIRAQIETFNVYLVSDAKYDRMQILMPIAYAKGLDVRALTALLEANFQNTLDARYAISDGIVQGVYLHPISTLTPGMVRSALEQVVNLGRNFRANLTGQRRSLSPFPASER